MDERLIQEQLKNLNIGDRIKMLHITQNRTMQEIAEASDLSKSMISKIENNKTVPSVAALVKIASALGTNVSRLVEQEGRVNTVMAPGIMPVSDEVIYLDIFI